MNSERLNVLLVAIICLLFMGLIGGAYAINSAVGLRSKDLANLKAKSQALQQEQEGLVIAKKNIAKYSELEKISHAIVPEDKNQAEAIRQLVNIAAAHQVSLASITFPASTLGNTSTGASASSAGAAPAPSAASTRTSQLQPVKNIPGVYLLPITVTSDINHPVAYDQFINFLAALENNRRTAQVSDITLQPQPDNHNQLSFTLVLNEYIKP